MIQELTTSHVIDELLRDEFADWSIEEAHALAEWYEELETDMGEPIEFDRVAIRCEWSSHESLSDIIEQYSDCPDNWYLALEWLEERTHVVQLEHSILLREF